MLQSKSHTLTFSCSVSTQKVRFQSRASNECVVDGRAPIIHVVYAHVVFQNATVLHERTTADLGSSCVGWRASVHIDYVTVIRLDQDLIFIIRASRGLDTALMIVLYFSGAQSHTSILRGETYHESFWRMFKILRKKHKSIELEILLQFTVGGPSDWISLNGLVPALLDFAHFLPFLWLWEAQQNKESASKQCTEQKESASNYVKKWITTVVKEDVFPSAKFRLKPEDMVMEYSEAKENGNINCSLKKLI